ncbi:universal stress protein [Bacillus changyiensis]|uniref:universal stress protein n=1 Tax=Bacillus changyiensis TaxID=3004103 RepID=UPI0022E43157|nr:universal stress protein [Bacillus changyiensis]MDA1476056.1 universal stress protein [Bacillus changyiensis]
MFKAARILVAFDEKDESRSALIKAIELTKRLGSKLFIAHVQEVKISPPYETINDEPMIYEDSTEEALASAKRVLNENQLTAEIAILEGDPANAILDHAEKLSADLIITGTRDQNRIKKLLFGSVSDKISTESEIPVLIIK